MSHQVSYVSRPLLYANHTGLLNAMLYVYPLSLAFDVHPMVSVDIFLHNDGTLHISSHSQGKTTEHYWGPAMDYHTGAMSGELSIEVEYDARRKRFSVAVEDELTIGF